MPLVSSLAIYFVLWWLVLFAILPFWVRNEPDPEADHRLGTELGAPDEPHLLRKAIVTTVVSALLFAVLYGVIVLFELRLEDFAG